MNKFGNLLSIETYSFKFEAKEDAEAWIAFVKQRIKTFDQKYGVFPKTKVFHKILESGEAIISFETTYYEKEYLIKMVMPTILSVPSSSITLKAEDLPRKLFIPLSALNISARLKKVLINLNCEYLGDVLTISKTELCLNKMIGKKTWLRLCDFVEEFNFSVNSYPKSWKPENAEELSKRYYPELADNQ